MRPGFRRLIVATVVAVTVGGTLWALDHFRNNPRVFTEAVRRADKVVLYEGLPHQFFEKRLLEEERRTKAVVELDGYPFYQEPLPLAAQDAEYLSELLSDPAAYQPWKGEKLCGGFHPDYAVEWHVGTSRYRALVCLGCGEFQLSRPGFWARTKRYEMNLATGESLVQRIGSYRKHRPRGSPQD